MTTKTRNSFALTSGVLLGAVTAFSLIALAAEPPAAKKPAWSLSASLGLTLARGNSDNAMFTGKVLAGRKAKDNELSLGLDGAYGESDKVKSADAVHGFAQCDLLLSKRAYGYLRLDALHDDIADVQYRLTLAPGGGFYFIKNTNTFLRGEVGPGGVYEKQGRHTQGYLSLRLGDRFEHKFSDRVKLWQMAEVLPQVDNLDNTVVNAELGVDTGLSKKLSLRTYLQDTYDNEPAPGRKKNDVKLVVALACTFF
jgi:putative salt-induced outer membrane protein YdiY